MRASALKYTILTLTATLAAVILLLMPLHAFLTVWGDSLVGHYTVLRLWKEVLLGVALLGVALLMIIDHKIRSHTLTRRLVWLILLYALVNIAWGVVAYKRHDVSAKALGYGLIIDLRFPAFFLVTWAIVLRTSRLRGQYQHLILWPALVVVVFGLLQAFVLPSDFLGHFGYGPHTIPPYETINHNVHYIRIESTLRGANPLGAYLLVPISYLSVLIVRGKRNWQHIVFLLAAVLTLYFSFSRSAWVGAVLSVGVILALSLRSQKAKQWVAAVVGVGVVILVGLLIGLHDSARFQNIFFHTQNHSSVATTSDQGHATALKNGLHDLLRQPLGRGPGSAGPASIYNNHPARIAENYFVQIGQETGWLGLLLFLLINAGVGYLLWSRRSDPLAFCLFASLIGLSFINLLSHAWADDTLAYVWWGLAGIAMVHVSPPIDAKPKGNRVKGGAKAGAKS
jgi:hypothetical protein